MTRGLIYRSGNMYRVVDINWERLVGVYYTPAQARHGWFVYESQGHTGCGFDVTKQDTYVIDTLRGIHEDKIGIAIRAGRQNTSGRESTRDREIDAAIDRLSTGL